MKDYKGIVVEEYHSTSDIARMRNESFTEGVIVGILLSLATVVIFAVL